MVVFGTAGEAYVSHIPMFGPPHDVQAVVAGSFTALDGGALPKTLSDRLYTFVPDKMSLDAFRSGSLGELQGQIFVGNFEAGGQALPSRFRFRASRVVHQHVLDAGAKEPELGYLLLGSRKGTFAVHRIAGSPSFDEVLEVELSGDVPSDAELAAGVPANLAGLPDAVAGRIGLVPAGKTVKAGSRSFVMKPKTPLSCLIGPEFSAPCP
jgi:hypothetical protein